MSEKKPCFVEVQSLHLGVVYVNVEHIQAITREAVWLVGDGDNQIKIDQGEYDSLVMVLKGRGWIG